MSPLDKLISISEKNKSILCVGLDIDPAKVPKSCGEGPKALARFALDIVEATADSVAAYKPNLAFYEAFGPEGMSLLKLICSRIPQDTVIILDGKRGDIGNSSEFYARAGFDVYNADWVTVNPLMGYDSVRPFLDRPDKGAFVLCLTSNPGSHDFQLLNVAGKPFYLHVAEKVLEWNRDGNCGLVVGATNPDQLTGIRTVAGNMPFLIPGIGAQGGDLEKAVLRGTDTFTKPALINVSRAVLYASAEADYAKAARAEVEKLNGEINALKNRPQ